MKKQTNPPSLQLNFQFTFSESYIEASHAKTAKILSFPKSIPVQDDFRLRVMNDLIKNRLIVK